MLRVPSEGGIGSLRDVLARLGEDAAVADLSIHTPDLDDVFFALTGNSAKEHDPVTTLTYAAQDSATMLGRELKHTLRFPLLLVGAIMVPVVFLLLFVYILGGPIGHGLGSPRRTSTSWCPASW